MKKHHQLPLSEILFVPGDAHKDKCKKCPGMEETRHLRRHPYCLLFHDFLENAADALLKIALAAEQKRADNESLGESDNPKTNCRSLGLILAEKGKTDAICGAIAQNFGLDEKNLKDRELLLKVLGIYRNMAQKTNEAVFRVCAEKLEALREVESESKKIEPEEDKIPATGEEISKEQPSKKKREKVLELCKDMKARGIVRLKAGRILEGWDFGFSPTMGNDGQVVFVNAKTFETERYHTNAITNVEKTGNCMTLAEIEAQISEWEAVMQRQFTETRRSLTEDKKRKLLSADIDRLIEKKNKFEAGAEKRFGEISSDFSSANEPVAPVQLEVSPSSQEALIRAVFGKLQALVPACNPLQHYVTEYGDPIKLGKYKGREVLLDLDGNISVCVIWKDKPFRQTFTLYFSDFSFEFNGNVGEAKNVELLHEIVMGLEKEGEPINKKIVLRLEELLPGHNLGYEYTGEPVVIGAYYEEDDKVEMLFSCDSEGIYLISEGGIFSFLRKEKEGDKTFDRDAEMFYGVLMALKKVENSGIPNVSTSEVVSGDADDGGKSALKNLIRSGEPEEKITPEQLVPDMKWLLDKFFSGYDNDKKDKLFEFAAKKEKDLQLRSGGEIHMSFHCNLLNVRLKVRIGEYFVVFLSDPWTKSGKFSDSEWCHGQPETGRVLFEALKELKCGNYTDVVS